ncbi:hypothetical protein OS493_035383 [Desmophyllum pertusum]|uniref:SLC26A/SulP transporter domain-containing protein n=1 Tax=Desmophyllum pertusum TaxID=174260 RepID=A0A9X0D6Z1_9CNID|nr:hypothetical protein OS493_035383 [Desmophyllum pertusum]
MKPVLTATHRHSRSEESTNKNHYLRTVYRKLASCTCSWNGVFSFLFRLAPILRWLPKYNVKKDLSADITGGVTVGIMHIPQGLAFAMLASLPPVTGLYTALIPSVGLYDHGWSTVKWGSLSLDPSPTPGNGSASSPLPTDTSSGLWTPIESVKMEIAISLSLLVGFIQVAMGAARLGFVATFLSDPTESAVSPQGQRCLLWSPLHFSESWVHHHRCALSSGVDLDLKQVNERYKNKMKASYPGGTSCGNKVIVGTAVSYGAAINEKFAVSIIGVIPKGLPPLSLPSFSLMSRIFPDAFVIAVVIFATNISLVKMFAKKHGYSIDPNQLCSVVVIALILLVLLFIAPLFFHLPKAILAAVVIANLIGLLRQFSRLKYLWKIHKPDAVVWFFTCFGVILLGVDVGLGVGVICTLFAVVLTLSRSNYSILGRVKETELYRDIKQCPMAFEVPGVKVLRFESSLYFGNVERFRNALVVATGLDPSTQQEPRKEIALANNDSDEKDELLENENNGQDYNCNGEILME